MKFYCFTFEDGYFCYCAGMSRNELAREILKHGKLISKNPA